MTRKSATAQIAPVASAQAGVISLAQAKKAGLSARQCQVLTDTGRWERLGRGVYRLAGAPPGWEQRVWAACLEAGGFASHRTAGWLFGLDGLGRTAPRELEVLVTLSNRRHANGAIVRRSRTLRPDHLSKAGGIPRTNLARTLIDLSEVLDAQNLELAFDAAQRKQGDLRSWLRRLLKKMPPKGHRGIAKLTALLDEKDIAVDSALEVELRRLLRSARIPMPVAGLDVIADNVHVAKVDFAWPRNKPRVALMAHGKRFHNNTYRWRRDLAQATQLSALGWRVIQFTAADVEGKPEELLRLVRLALAGHEASAELGPHFLGH